MYKILLVGGIKEYTIFYADIINVLQKLNGEITILNTTFISLQPYHKNGEKADLYIGDKYDGYYITKKRTSAFIHNEDEDIQEFDNSLNNSFDFVVTENAWFCNSVEILKYHNLLKLNGYLIRWSNRYFPRSAVAHVQREDAPDCDLNHIDTACFSNAYTQKIHDTRHILLLQSAEKVFQRTHPNIFKKITDINYDIKAHSIKYEEHCNSYLNTLS